MTLALTFARSLEPALALLVVALVLGALVLVSRGLWRALPRPTAAGIFAVKVLAMLLLLVLWLEPQCERADAGAGRGTVLVLVDQSASMGISDGLGGASRLATARAALQAEGPAGDWFDRLAADTEVRLASFARGVHPLDHDALSALAPETRASRIRAAIARVPVLAGARDPEAIVLLSDGNETDPQAAVAVVRGRRGRRIPVYAVGIGSRLGAGQTPDDGPPDLALASLTSPAEAMVRQEVRLSVSVVLSGREFAAQQGRVPLTAEVATIEADAEANAASTDTGTNATPEPSWQPVDRTVVTPTGPGRLEAALTWRPDRPGRYQLRVRAPVPDGDVVPENNVVTAVVRVTNPKLSVLLVEGALRWEYTFLKREWASDRHVALTTAIDTGAGRFTVGGMPVPVDLARGLPATAAGFSTFDVIVLGELPDAAFTPAARRALRDFVVRDGHGLVVLGGQRNFMRQRWAQAPLAPLCPMALPIGAGKFAAREFSLSVAPAGVDHPVTTGLQSYMRAAGRLTVSGANRFRKVKPGATPLLMASPGELVLAAAQEAGKGRVVWFATDETHRWRFNALTAGGEPLFSKLWGQALRYVAERESTSFDDRPVSLLAPPGRQRPRTAVPLRVRVLDRQRNYHTRATVTITVRGPDRKSRRLTCPAAENGRGEYETSFTPETPGRYTLVAEARDPTGALGRDVATLNVGEAVDEFARVAVNVSGLTALARETGGLYLDLPDLASLPERLKKRATRRTLRAESTAWNSPLYLLMLVGLLAGEWWWRRRHHLR